MFNRDKIKSILDKKGWTKYKLAKEAGLGQTTIHDILGGKKVTPNAKTLAKIADALGVSVNDFFTDKEKLDITLDVINESHQIIGNYFSDGNLDDSIYDIVIQFDKEKFSKKEQSQIIDYINYIISKREKKE